MHHGVVLAAGRGGRMRPLTDSIPKALAPCGGRTLLREQMDFLRTWVDHVHVTVGYLPSQVKAAAELWGAASVVDIGEENNAWWIGRSAIGRIGEAISVVTCDNLMEIDVDTLWQDYVALGEPPCMVVPTPPVPGTQGDFIFHDAGVVTKLSRSEVSDFYCCGLQILNPASVAEVVSDRATSFHQVWDELIAEGLLKVATTQPTRWLGVDTAEQLSTVDSWLREDSSNSSLSG